jgi:exonuclease III
VPAHNTDVAVAAHDAIPCLITKQIEVARIEDPSAKKQWHHSLFGVELSSQTTCVISFNHRIRWHISNKCRNQMMRTIHGNTRPHKRNDWTAQHRIPYDAELHIGTINTNGLATYAKRKSITDSQLDIIALTETHLQSHLHAAYSEEWKHNFCYFSPDPDTKHYNGVALLLKKSKFWKVTPISFEVDNPCHKFAAIGRLIAVQAWFGHGGCSVLLYNIYAPSGSRWEQPKRKQLYDLLDAVTLDSVARGQLPTVLLGDFNMTIEESPKIAQLLYNRTWCDTRNVAEPSMFNAPTCHVGPAQGSKIDHIFVSPALYDLSFNFQVTKIPTFKDHSQVSIKIKVPTPVQTRMSLRKPSCLQHLHMPTQHDRIIPYQASQNFSRAIANSDIDTAYKILIADMNKIFNQIAKSQNLPPIEADSTRGRIVFHDQRRYPPAIQAHASTLQTRKIFKCLNQAIEVTKCSNGYRRNRTWNAIAKNTSYLPEPYKTPVSDILQMPASHDTATKLVDLFEKALSHIFRKDNSERIAKWKQRMRSHTNQPFKWLKSRAKTQAVKVATADVITSVNSHARLDAISKIWKDIYDTHKKGEPSIRHFLQKYGEHIKSDLCSLNPITGEQLRKKLSNTRPSAPGMDFISPHELCLLSQWCPAFFDELAILFNCIEKSGVWPADLPKGAVSFIPKDQSECPAPSNYRPLTILSSIYRLWAATRHDQLCQIWLPKWKSNQAYGLKQTNAADSLAFDTCLQIALDMQNNYLTSGLSYDMRKCFDTIPVCLVLQIFNHRGADDNVVRAMTGFYQQHQKFFRVDGAYSKAYRPHNGIIQGCPLSMLLLTSLITTWIEFSQSKIPYAVPRCYADDLSLCTKARTKNALIEQTRGMHQLPGGANLGFGRIFYTQSQNKHPWAYLARQKHPGAFHATVGH